MGHGRAGSIAYWSIGAAFTVLGFVDLVAIGAPFFLTGLAMLAVGRWRHDRAVLWPVLLGVWALVLGYVLIAPLGCRTFGGAPLVAGLSLSHTSCGNVLGIDYSGTGLYNPPLLPALVAGLALGAIVGFVSRHVLGGRTASADRA
jgi:hypothetical protein